MSVSVSHDAKTKDFVSSLLAYRRCTSDCLHSLSLSLSYTPDSLHSLLFLYVCGELEDCQPTQRIQLFTQVVGKQVTSS